jgi:hypothetical protein
MPTVTTQNQTKSYWKHWAAVGFCLAGAAYTSVVMTKKLPHEEDLVTYQKVGIGLLTALVSAGVFGGLRKLREYCGEKKPEAVVTVVVPTPRETIRIAVATEHTKYASLDETSRSTDIAIDNDALKANECNRLVEQYFEDYTQNKPSSDRYLQLALEYLSEFKKVTGLSNKDYLAQLKAHGYRYSLIPSEQILQNLRRSPGYTQHGKGNAFWQQLPPPALPKPTDSTVTSTVSNAADSAFEDSHEGVAETTAILGQSPDSESHPLPSSYSL